MEAGGGRGGGRGLGGGRALQRPRSACASGRSGVLLTVLQQQGASLDRINIRRIDRLGLLLKLLHPLLKGVGERLGSFEIQRVGRIEYEGVLLRSAKIAGTRSADACLTGLRTAEHSAVCKPDSAGCCCCGMQNPRRTRRVEGLRKSPGEANARGERRSTRRARRGQTHPD